MRKVWMYVLFFMSGASALMYELVWQRLLNLVFGVSTLSVSAVLAAFMGGLALGGLAGPSRFFSRAGVRTVASCSLYSHKAGDGPPPRMRNRLEYRHAEVSVHL